MQELFLTSDSTIFSALEKMDQIQRKLLIVVDPLEKFIGLVSIGDIQRAILSSIDLSSSITTITKKDSVIASPIANLHEVKALMLSIRAEYIPVVDEKGKILEIHYWENLMLDVKRKGDINQTAKGVIMAGGKGTRMRPISDVIPKPLMPINGHSFIEEILFKFEQFGITSSFISLGHESDLIKFYLSKKELRHDIKFLVEQKPLGTAGALSLIDKAGTDTLVLMNCDIIVDVDIQELIEFHKTNNNTITVVSAIYKEQSSYGEFEVDNKGRIIKVKEKSSKFLKINTGMYVIESSVIDNLEYNTHIDITTLITSLIHAEHRIGIFPVSEGQWRDYGTLDKYLFQTKST
ncbi:sugar phosphate nucleotidyltransferase [Schleiferiaceae bacterium]|nr:sugar phosphate nucleotidyltransferase [Schleiferiaceae bacterium]